MGGGEEAEVAQGGGGRGRHQAGGGEGSVECLHSNAQKEAKQREGK